MNGVTRTERLAPFLFGACDVSVLVSCCFGESELPALSAAQAFEPDLAGAVVECADAHDFREASAADGTGHHLAGEVRAERIGLLEWRRWAYHRIAAALLDLLLASDEDRGVCLSASLLAAADGNDGPDLVSVFVGKIDRETLLFIAGLFLTGVRLFILEAYALRPAARRPCGRRGGSPGGRALRLHDRGYG
jgi:hypothetical protein